MLPTGWRQLPAADTPTECVKGEKKLKNLGYKRVNMPTNLSLTTKHNWSPYLMSSLAMF